MAVAPRCSFWEFSGKEKNISAKKKIHHIFWLTIRYLWTKYEEGIFPSCAAIFRFHVVSRKIRSKEGTENWGHRGPFYFLHHDKKNSDILSFLVGKHFAIHSMIKREVKMAGLCLTSFFAFLWTATKSRSVKSQKKQDQSPAILTEQTW